MSSTREAVARALANHRIMRNGAPPIANALDLLPKRLLEEVFAEADAAIAAHLVALEASGFVVAPTEATDEMLMHGRDALVLPDSRLEHVSEHVEQIYRAMLQARPS